jgi:hypothetical protein
MAGPFALPGDRADQPFGPRGDAANPGGGCVGGVRAGRASRAYPGGDDCACGYDCPAVEPGAGGESVGGCFASRRAEPLAGGQTSGQSLGFGRGQSVTGGQAWRRAGRCRT